MSLDGHRSALVPDAPAPNSCLRVARPSMNTVTLSAVEFDVVWRGAGARRATGGAPACLARPDPHGAPAYRGGGLGGAARAPAGVGRRGRSRPRTSPSPARGAGSPGGGSRVGHRHRPRRAGRWDRRRRARTALRRRGGAHAVHLARRRRGRRPRHVRDRDRAGPPSSPLSTWRRRCADPSGAGLRADLVDRGVDPAEAGLIARMLHGVDRRAQISVLVPDRLGILRRAGEPLEVLDGPRGRYLTTRCRGADGTAWTCVAPADDRRLRHRLSGWFDAARAISPGRRAASAAGLPR